jgi:hypothetical protein
MRARTQITVLVSFAALSLGVGIPVFAFTVTPKIDVIQGTVVSVAPHRHTVLVHSYLGTIRPGRDVLLQLPPRQRVVLTHGSEDLARLLPGQYVTAQLRRGTLDVQRIALSTAAPQVFSTLPH